jgi:hypothetical protein
MLRRDASQRHRRPVVPIAHRRALENLCDGLAGAGLPWAVTGSAALALQGIRVDCRDLDVVTSAAGAYDVERVFREHAVEPVGFATRDGIRGHVGRLRVGNVDVEVWGDIQNLSAEGTWSVPPRLDVHRVWVDCGAVRCPVLPLDYLRDAYEAMGRPEKLRLIDAVRGSGA